MDAETVKAWAPVFAAFIGGFIGGSSAYLVALANVRGQRESNRDQALREWRAAPVRALLELMVKRAVVYQLLGTAKSRHQLEQQAGKADEEGAARVRELIEELAATPDIGIYASAAASVQDDGIVLAISALYEAENASHRLWVGSEKSLIDPEGQALVLAVGGQLSQAIAAAQRAAEAYVFARESKPRKERRPRDQARGRLGLW